MREIFQSQRTVIASSNRHFSEKEKIKAQRSPNCDPCTTSLFPHSSSLIARKDNNRIAKMDSTTDGNMMEKVVGGNGGGDLSALSRQDHHHRRNQAQELPLKQCEFSRQLNTTYAPLDDSITDKYQGIIFSVQNNNDIVEITGFELDSGGQMKEPMEVQIYSKLVSTTIQQLIDQYIRKCQTPKSFGT